jgi:hypothetical protein
VLKEIQEKKQEQPTKIMMIREMKTILRKEYTSMKKEEKKEEIKMRKIKVYKKVM